MHCYPEVFAAYVNGYTHILGEVTRRVDTLKSARVYRLNEVRVLSHLRYRQVIRGETSEIAYGRSLLEGEERDSST
jgi:hypothetical protein